MGNEARVALKHRRNPLHAKLGSDHGWYREVVATFPSRYEAGLKERQLIRELGTLDSQGGANRTEGGDGGCLKKHTPEAKARISSARRGKKRGPLSPQHRAALSLAHKGKSPSPEHRANLAASQKGKPRNPAAIAKMAATKKGSRLTTEHRASIGAALRGKKVPVEKLKTHCVNGHLFDEATTYMRPKGGRGCRACRRKESRNTNPVSQKEIALCPTA